MKQFIISSETDTIREAEERVTILLLIACLARVTIGLAIFCL